MDFDRGADNLTREVCMGHVLYLNVDFTPQGWPEVASRMEKDVWIPQNELQQREEEKLFTAEFTEKGRRGRGESQNQQRERQGKKDQEGARAEDLKAMREKGPRKKDQEIIRWI